MNDLTMGGTEYYPGGKSLHRALKWPRSVFPSKEGKSKHNKHSKQKNITAQVDICQPLPSYK